MSWLAARLVDPNQRRFFVAAVAVGLIATALAALTSRADDWHPIGLFLVLLVGNLFSEWVAVPHGVPETSPWVITSAVPLVLAVVLMGPAPAMAIAIASLVLVAVRYRTKLLDMGANFANYASFVIVGSLLARWAVESFDLAPDEFAFAVLTLVIYVEVECMSFVANVLCDRIAYQQRIVDLWRREAERFFDAQAPTALLTAVAAFAYGAIGIGALGLLVVVQLMHQRVAHGMTVSLERAEALEEQAKELAKVSESRGRLVGQVLQAEETERRRMAEALHDDALQDLMLARQALAGLDGAAERPRAAIDRAIGQLRAAIFDLHPAVLEHAGLEAALREVAVHQGERGGFMTRVEVDPDACGCHDPLLFLLGREQLANAAKHAAATEVALTVSRVNGIVVMEVADNGRGMDPESRLSAISNGHIGLASSAERVEALGGKLEIESGPGRGTRIRTRLPVAAG